MRLWRYTGYGCSGGIVIARTKAGAIKKLRKKFGDEIQPDAEVWSWKRDDYYDAENSGVINCYDR